MRKLLVYTVLIFLNLPSPLVFSQQESIIPSITGTGSYLGETPPLRDLPAISPAEWQAMEERSVQKMLNPKIRTRSFPYQETALPRGPDPVWQQQEGGSRESREPLTNFTGQTSPVYPPDANGTVGPNHYMQTINATYSIYNKSGMLVAGPTALNTLFTGVPGSSCNNGDPVVLYDEQADRWLVTEFSLCGSTDYMLMAVSTTNDPTGTWHKYSFDVADMPDYPKFGIWQDGYYMATNTPNGSDIYVFERGQMLIGGTAQFVGFDNPWRPTSIDGFMCVPPADNDGAFAPAGAPGIFLTINDDAVGGGSDQLWIYELEVDWATLSNSTFTRVQQIDVAAFDSNFGTNWDNITQPGTSQKLDAIPQVIMNVPQYRNFGSYQTLVCCHTVDVDNTNHAGIRWYELRNTGSSWSVRQQGTYAPDEHSRWMGSIQLNGAGEIGLAYSISSATEYPGIRYCGQSANAYTAATGNLDVAEEIIHTGAYSQANYNRWGDYAALQIDPDDDETFWFTTEYIGDNNARQTRIASFQIGPVALAANFSAGTTTPAPDSPVIFTDISTGGPVSWSWTFTPGSVTYHNGTNPASQNPEVSFDTTGYYTVSLYVTDGMTGDTEIKTNFILAYNQGLWTGTVSADWNTAGNWDGNVLPTASSNVVINTGAMFWPSITGDFSLGTQCHSLTFKAGTEMEVAGDFSILSGKLLDMTAGGILNITGNWTNSGTFASGAGVIKFNNTAPVSITSNGTTSDITIYSLSTFTKGMTPLNGPITIPTGDDNNSNVPIGFIFNYAGEDYTTAKISMNGWLSLNLSGELGYANSALFTSSTPNATIAPWWDDLYGDAQCSVGYKTTGTAPNRVFTAEWKRMLTYYSGSTTRISFQVHLYEGSNTIELHYGNMEAGSHHTGESASIGIEDLAGGSGHFIEATTGSTTVGVTSLVSTTNWPAVNYRFQTPDPTQVFNNLIINNTGGEVIFDISSVINGDINVMPGGSFRVTPGNTLEINGNPAK